MGAIADHRISGVFAGAKEHIFGLCGCPFHWREISALVRAVAERLVRGQAAGTPEIRFVSFNPCADRGTLRDFRELHGGLSFGDVPFGSMW